jgi:hypothetical protein
LKAVDRPNQNQENKPMKNYSKPSLKGLGLLRMVTKFSVGDPHSNWGNHCGNIGNGLYRSDLQFFGLGSKCGESGGSIND